MARMAGVLDDLARALAHRALHRGGEEAHHVDLGLTRTMASGAGDGLGTGLVAPAAALRAALEMRVSHTLGAALAGLVAGEFELDGTRGALLARIGGALRRTTCGAVACAVGAAPRRPTAEGAVAARPGTRTSRARRIRVLRGEAAGLHSIVAGLFVGIRQGVVGLGDLFEALLGARLLAHVGVHRAGLGAKRLFDVLGRSILRNAENVVVVLVGGGCQNDLTPQVAGKEKTLALFYPRRAAYI